MRVNGFIKGFFIFIVFIVILVFFDVFLFYYFVIFWVVIFVVIFNLVKNKICICFGECNGFVVLMIIVIICFIVFMLLVIIFFLLVYEFNLVYSKLQYNDIQFLMVVVSLFVYFFGWVRSFFVDYNFDSVQQIQQQFFDVVLKGGQYLVGSVFLIGKGIFGFIVSFGIMLYLLFFLLKDGFYLVLLIFEFLLLLSYVKQYLFVKFVVVVCVMVKGIVVVVLVQGVLGGFVFWIVGLDGSIFWGVLMVFLLFILVVGLVIIWVLVVIYFFVIGQLWQGVFIVGFFVIVIGLVDNILCLLLVGKDIRMLDYLIFIVILGGMEIYGINGFVIGLLIVVLFIVCWNLLLG